MSLIELLQHDRGFYVATVFVLGLLMGSFFNVVIYRLPIMLKRQWKSECVDFLADAHLVDKNQAFAHRRPEKFNLLIPHSSCPKCGHAISAMENIPVISYLALRGRCRQCKTPISPRYPLVEFLTASVTAITAWHFGFTPAAAGAILLSWALICLTFIDLDHQYLPDNITLPFLWLGLLFNLSATYVDIDSAIIGAVAGYLTLWLVYQLFKLLTGKEGMGFGDFKLLAVLGAWLGWQMLPLIIILSSLVGSVFGVSMILFRHHEQSRPIPFGPYLAIAGWIALLWGEHINTAYLQWINV